MDKKNHHFKLWLYFSLVIFSTIMLFIINMVIIWFILYKAGVAVFDIESYRMSFINILIISFVIGGGVSVVVGRLLIRPLKDLGDAFEALSKGDFSARMSTKGYVSDIREIGERFNNMAEELSRVETLSNDFVANVSHEFKTPLSAIEGYATLLQNPLLSEEKRDYYTEKILNNTKRLTNLSSNILMLSKLENQETILDKKQYKLDEQLRRAILLLEDKWSEKDLNFDIELESLRFYGNENLLDQVWLNLLDNAIKHSVRGGTVQVFLTAEGQSASVVITNFGESIDEETRKHIFEKFYQGDSSHKAEGNGLGLALVKRIVELCCGAVTVESSESKGTAFTVILPNKE